MRKVKISPAICVAVRKMIDTSPITREAIALAMEVDPSTVSRWMTYTEPSYETVSELEQLCEKHRGYALELADYARPPGPTNRERLARDTSIDDDLLQVVLASYDTARAITQLRHT
jgi:hypothetical protein